MTAAPIVAMPEVRLLALGDSYTIGEGVAPDERWPMQLAAALRARGCRVAEPVIVARTGWTTEELSAAIDGACPRGPFDIVTLLIGVNDQFRGRRAGDYRTPLRALLARATTFAGGKPDRVLLVSIPDWGATPFAHGRDRARIAREIDAFNAVGREEAAGAAVRYVDVTTLSRRAADDEERPIGGDGLHPSPRMYAEWVRLVLPVAVHALG